jgi:hypothetical protein
VGVQTATIDTTPTAATAGNLRYQLASTEGVLYVQEGGPKRFSCILNAVTVLTQCQAAPAAGLRAYVTSVTLSNQAATVQTLDVVYGTGSNCATAAAAITHKVQFGTNATTTSPQSYGMSFPTPLVPVAANAICVRPSPRPRSAPPSPGTSRHDRGWPRCRPRRVPPLVLAQQAPAPPLRHLPMSEEAVCPECGWEWLPKGRPTIACTACCRRYFSHMQKRWARMKARLLWRG